MSDLFHEKVPDEFIEDVFVVMALAAHHTFQTLTKRPERMLRFFSAGWREKIAEAMLYPKRVRLPPRRVFPRFFSGWPLANVWLGVSLEN